MGCKVGGVAGIKPLLPAAEAVALARAGEARFVDASWFLPGVERDANEEYAEERIPGARRFDFDELSDNTSPLPHMLPPAEVFESWARTNGISNETPIVVYATKDCFSSPRVWWTFKAFQHAGDVSILDGGLEGWKAAGGEVETGAPASPAVSQYTCAGLNDKLVVNSDDVLQVMMTGSAQICDARPPARFAGEVDEPRPGLARGHIPGSLNVPFASLLDEDDKTTFLPPIQIRAKMHKAGIIPGSRVIATCGSGVTACTLAFALTLLGQPPELAPVYDGSWADWGRPDLLDLPKMTELRPSPPG
jgi:thiosulfate/3-mercaptopyruvate sulfurtransferase